MESKVQSPEDQPIQMSQGLSRQGEINHEICEKHEKGQASVSRILRLKIRSLVPAGEG